MYFLRILRIYNNFEAQYFFYTKRKNGDISSSRQKTKNGDTQSGDVFCNHKSFFLIYNF